MFHSRDFEGPAAVDCSESSESVASAIDVLQRLLLFKEEWPLDKSNALLGLRFLPPKDRRADGPWCRSIDE